jgi:peptidoglycan/xylan/chitin deacetylase (PgdA/CDA1 family)
MSSRRSESGTRRHCPRPGRCRFLIWPAVLWLSAASGCGTDPLSHVEEKRATIVVLTFDDGPVAADVLDPAGTQNMPTLLDPLNAILDTLAQRGLQAVFYVKGPGNRTAGVVLGDTFADGILSIHRAGQVLGYHAYDHDPAIWVRLPVPMSTVRDDMREDLDQLESFLDGLLGPRGLSRGAIFTRVFRQPFGGGGIAQCPAIEVAHERGWTYHGFRIDSVDWTDNADIDPALFVHLPIATEGERVEYVRYRLREGAERNRGLTVVDVLFHVNAFTARHLNDWIDELQTVFAEQTGALPTFSVPDDYLNNDDPVTDMSVICDLLKPWDLIDLANGDALSALPRKSRVE